MLREESPLASDPWRTPATQHTADITTGKATAPPIQCLPSADRGEWGRVGGCTGERRLRVGKGDASTDWEAGGHTPGGARNHVSLGVGLL